MINTWEHMIDFVFFDAISHEAKIGEVTILDERNGDFSISDAKQKTSAVLTGKNLHDIDMKTSKIPPLGSPPDFGLTCLGTSSAMDANGLSSNQIFWAGHFSFLVDFGPATVPALKAVGLNPTHISHVIITHMHEDHVGGALAYFHWAREWKQPIRLLVEPGIYEYFKIQMKMILGKELEEEYPIEILPLHFYKTTTVGENENAISIDTIPAFHGTPVTMLRFHYQNRSLFHTSDHTFDPYRIRQILKNEIPPHISRDLIHELGNNYDPQKHLFDEARAEEILRSPFFQNPEIVLYETGTQANPPETNAGNHTSPYALGESLDERERSLVLANHGPNTGNSGIQQVPPFSTWTKNKMPGTHASFHSNIPVSG